MRVCNYVFLSDESPHMCSHAVTFLFSDFRGTKQIQQRMKVFEFSTRGYVTSNFELYGYHVYKNQLLLLRAQF